MDNGILLRLNEFAYLTCKLITDLASCLALRILQSHLEPPTNFFPQFCALTAPEHLVLPGRALGESQGQVIWHFPLNKSTTTTSTPEKWKLFGWVWSFATPWTVHGILQARILKWVAFPVSSRSFQPSNQTRVSHIAGRFFTSWATREATPPPPDYRKRVIAVRGYRACLRGEKEK